MCGSGVALVCCIDLAGGEAFAPRLLSTLPSAVTGSTTVAPAAAPAATVAPEAVATTAVASTFAPAIAALCGIGFRAHE